VLTVLFCFSTILRWRPLPSEVGKGLVGFRHSVRILTLRDGGTFPLVGGDQFVGQLHVGGAALLFADRSENPAEGERLLAISVHLHWNLVRSPTDSLGSNFNVRLDILHRLLKHFDRRAIFDPVANLFQGVVENPLSHRLLAVPHQAVDELGCEERLVTWIGTKRSAAGGDLTHDAVVRLLLLVENGTGS